MYIHKIVIDANCINAKGGLQAMNQLEAYHDAGVVEILKTTTLNKEFSTAPLQKKKSEKFQTIGGNCHFSPIDGKGAEALPGGVIGNTNLALFEKLFPEKLTGDALHRSLRDTLHIDQSILNHCDYFVTNEKRLIDGGKRIPEILERIIITSPEQCLDEIKVFFYKQYGTTEPTTLENIINATGPIILGSNTCYGFRVIDPITREIMLSANIENNKLLVNAVFRDKKGIKQLEISPGNKSQFFNNDLSISCGGGGGIIVGENSFGHFMVGNDNEINLAARVTHSGRVVFFKAKINALDSLRYISVNKQTLTLKGVVLD